MIVLYHHEFKKHMREPNIISQIIVAEDDMWESESM